MVSNMNTNKTKRNPLLEVVSFEALAIAHNMYVQGQRIDYWEKAPRPLRPTGSVPYEVYRQAATFLVPLAGMAAATIAFGFDSLVFSAPAALVAGYLLDKQLKNAIKKQFKLEMELDRGRFEGTHRLAHELGMRPEEITIAMIAKMEQDYRAEMAKRARHEANKQEAATRNHALMVQATERLRARQAAGAPPLDYSGRGHATAGVAAAGVAAAAASGVTFADVADADGVIDPVHIDFEEPQMVFVNPESGLPMANNYIDVGGNPLGTSAFHD